MSSAPAQPLAEDPTAPAPGTALQARPSVAWTSLAFAILQSVCTAVVTINGIRFAIGLGALAMTTGAGSLLRHFHHTEWLRWTLLVGALLGSVVNLAVLWQARRLRNRPSARWRQRPRTPRQLRSDRAQFVLAIASLVLIAVEEYFHLQLNHTL